MKFGYILVALAASVSWSQGKDHDSGKHARRTPATHDEAMREHEVTVGTQVWGYSRVYPLLDGMFQDVASIRVSPLTLDSNGSNGASLDALQQSFSASATASPKNSSAATTAGNGGSDAAAPTPPPSSPSPAPFSMGLTTKSDPSFPASKQMENQIDLLWERLSRMVGAMTRPDNMSADDLLYLVKFDTGIFPFARKKQLLDVTYTIGCSSGGAPVVVDLFPRIGAVNIASTKYRDTSVGLSSVISFFTLGFNASYNREHLRVSQLLGQSAYITGHGIGQSEFGWLFGMSIGDDTITPGERSTFALIDVPKGCQTPTVVLKSAEWSKLPASNPTFSAVQLPAPRNMDCMDCVESVEFTRSEYDPRAARPVPVMVTIRLREEMDQQQTVTVNGRYLKRARDTFGRATSGGGSGGLLESATLDINTWVAAGSRTLVLNLDGSTLGDTFPTILLSSPTGLIDIAQGRSARTTISVSGRVLYCEADACKSNLPSVAYRRAVPSHLGIARWIEPNANKDERIDKICITALDTVEAAGGPAGGASIQTISDDDETVWGPAPEVGVLYDNPDRIERLRCDVPQGSRLICDAPDANTKVGERRSRLKVEVIDLNHRSGLNTVPIKGYVSTRPCTEGGTGLDSCRRPLIWKTGDPQLDASTKSWTMAVQLVNVDPRARLSLGPMNAVVECEQPGMPCSANVKISIGDLPKIQDVMHLHIADANGRDLGRLGAITNLYSNIGPVITEIDAAKKHFSGQNLIFDTVRVGENGPTYPITCPTTTECTVAADYQPGGSGYLYFVHKSQLVPFLKQNPSGAISAVSMDAQAGAPVAAASVAPAGDTKPAPVKTALAATAKKPPAPVKEAATAGGKKDASAAVGKKARGAGGTKDNADTAIETDDADIVGVASKGGGVAADGKQPASLQVALPSVARTAPRIRAIQ